MVCCVQRYDKKLLSLPKEITKNVKTMKNSVLKLLGGVLPLLGVPAALGGCNSSTIGTGQQAAGGAPYEVIAVVEKPQWEGIVGDTLREIFALPVDYVNQYEPRMDLMRVMRSAFEGFIKVHRNVLFVTVDPSQQVGSSAVKNKYADGQLMVYVNAPSDEAMVKYLSENKEGLLKAFEDAERERAIKLNSKHKEGVMIDKIQKMFGFTLDLPRGYTSRGTSGDSLLVTSFEYPVATQGIAIYSYPYTGKSDFELENLVRQRNNFVKNIPGPSDGSYMKTVDIYGPEVTYKRINGRFWAEMRGFWDLQNDFMGGPMLSWSTLDKENNKVICIDCYVFSPKHGQRDLLRGLEHLIYSVKFPSEEQKEQK